MGSEVLVALLVTGVLWDEVKVLATDDEGAVHLGGDNGSGQDTSTDGDLASEWALLVWVWVSACSVIFVLFFVSGFDVFGIVRVRPAIISCPPDAPGIAQTPPSSSHPVVHVAGRLTDVGSLNGGLWGLESKTNILVPSAAVLASAGRLDLDLGVKEDVWLLLEGALSLDGQFGGHFCGWWMSRWSKVVKSDIRLVVVELLRYTDLGARQARRD